MTDEIEVMGPTKDFEDLKQVDKNGIEYWMARELTSPLGYTQWRSFEDVVKRAMQACLNSGQFVENHFADASKMVEIGSSTVREVKDWKLDRYACYLIAQNGDSRKREIALAQTYFALQTRRQELIGSMTDDQRRVFIRGEVANENKKLFSTARKVGVNHFGWFNDAGYRGLYGKGIGEIEVSKGLKKGELLDRAGSTELAANLFRITQTDEKLKKGGISSESQATYVHLSVGREVRETIKKIGGELPENLRPEKHIKEVKKELKKVSRLVGETGN
ncbi:MAG: DNA damage-inducible protein D [Patescibacteria group bacterium]